MTPTKTQRWSLLLTVAAGLLLITLDNSVLYTALPTLTKELGATPLQGLWIINAYPLVMAGLLLGAGTLGDRLGHRRMFLIGLVIFGIASLLAAFAPDANLLIAARALLAVGAAAMMPATLALISLTFEDERERNLAIAVWGCISIIGSAIGPIVGGVLLAHFWWGAVFLINVPIVLLAMVGAVLFAPHGTPDAGKPWDLISSLLSLVALSGLVVAIKEIAHAPPNGVLAAGASLVFVVGLVLFLRRQRRLPYPMLDVAIFRNAPFLAGVLSAAFAMFAIAGLQLLTTQRDLWRRVPAPRGAAAADHRRTRHRHRRRAACGGDVRQRPGLDHCRAAAHRAGHGRDHFGGLHRDHRQRAAAPRRHGVLGGGSVL